MIERNQKFLVAMANSFCLDFGTDNFFQKMNNNIVLMSFDFHGNYADFASPHSYIKAADFPMVKALAKYLIQLDYGDL